MTVNYIVAKTNTGHFSQPSDTYSRCSFTDPKTHKARPPRPPSNKNVLSVLSNKNVIFFPLHFNNKIQLHFPLTLYQTGFTFQILNLICYSQLLPRDLFKEKLFHFYDEGWIVDTHSSAAHISVWMTSNLKPWLTVVCVKDLSDE